MIVSGTRNEFEIENASNSEALWPDVAFISLIILTNHEVVLDMFWFRRIIKTEQQGY